MIMDGQSGFDEGPGEVNLVARVLCSIAIAELDMPHIVLTRSIDTGETTYSGPYETGLKALAAAEAELQVDHDAGGRGDLSFQVAALYPALDITAETCDDTTPSGGAEGTHTPAALPGSPSGPRLVHWLRESLWGRTSRPCRQCGCARSRLVVAPPRRSARGRR